MLPKAGSTVGLIPEVNRNQVQQRTLVGRGMTIRSSGEPTNSRCDIANGEVNAGAKGEDQRSNHIAATWKT